MLPALLELVMKNVSIKILLILSLVMGATACSAQGRRNVASAIDLGMRNFTAPCDLRTAPIDDINQEVQNYERDGFKLVSVQKLTRSAEQTYPSNTCSFIFVHQ